MGYQLSTVTLGPILLLQGQWVRRRIERLAEPPGPREGTAGQGRGLRLLLTGDSSAAGVGAPHQDQALLGQIVSRLAPSFRVEWTLCARTGATTHSTLAMLRELGPRTFDVAVTALGVNDVTSGSSRSAWRRRQRELWSFLRSACDVSHIVVSGLPPVHGFLALPQPLRWYLGTRARQFDRDIAREVANAPGTSFVDNTVTRDAELMASDGFHPGPGVYAIWGRQVTDQIRSVYTKR